ncbi:MAG: hypothetical protein M0Z38_12090 [Deltaproteobacteria bacterium]|nr:hypothetical protein [Deltaproteobacteria bacterium]
MRRSAATIVLFICLFLPSAIMAAEESLEAVETDLAAVLKEMDAMSSELDRIEEFTAAPKATALRIEILKVGDLPGPVSGRLHLGGSVEHEKEWSRSERDLFAGGAPLVLQVPVLPGAYAGRIEVAHPAWKTTPAADFQANARKGETVVLKLLLAAPPGKADPVLSQAAGK